MQETIVVKSKVEGKYPYIEAENGGRYGVKNTADLSPFQVGQTYTLEYSERSVTNPKTGRDFKARDFIRIIPKTNGDTNGKYTTEDKKAFEKKDMWMAKECCLKCSVEMVKAWVEWSKEVEDLQPSSEILDQMRKKWYQEFLDEITK